MLPRWLIKVGFHLLYYQMAWSYELVAWLVSFGQWKSWRRMALQFLHPGPTLELAYGTGVFFADLVEAGYKPVGIDLSPYMARQASKRLRCRNHPVALNQAKAQALPFPSNYFVNVVATFPTNYMLEDKTMAEVHRVLRSPEVTESEVASGRLVIVFEGQLRGPWPVRPLVDWLYNITDQRSLAPTKPLNLLAGHNFRAHWETVEQQGVVAKLLIAERIE